MKTEDFVLGLLVAIFLGCIWLYLSNQNLRHQFSREWKLYRRAATIGAFIGSAVAAVLLLGALLAYHWISSLDSNFRSQLLVVLGSLTVGSLLFLFRLWLRAVYGITETLVGCFIALYLARSKANGQAYVDADFALAILTASVYLIVRGLDNIHQGITKDPKDALFHRLRQRKGEA